MTEQASLFAPEDKLTERQAHALEMIRERGSLTSVELGAYLHELRRTNGGRGHSYEGVCQFCSSEGASMGRRLREMALVKFSSKRGGWYDPTKATAESSGKTSLDPADSEIPF